MRRIALMIALAACTAGSAAAQVGATNPAVATQLPVAGRPLDRAVTPRAPSGPGIVTEPAPGLGADPAADVQALQVKSISFTGVTVLSRAALDVLARPYVGRAVSFRELTQLTREVEAAYRKLGLLAARCLVPEQKVAGGAVTLAVFEGRYGTIKVQGNKVYSERFIRRFFGFASPGGLVRQEPLLKSLLVLREMPNLNIRSAIVAGKAPGTTDLVLAVTEAKPFHFGYEYNNFGIRLVGRNRASVDLSSSDTFTDGDELSFRYTELFPSDSDPIYQANYSVPVFDAGGRLAATYLRSKTRVGGAFTALDLRGDVQIGALSYAHPLTRTLRKATSLSGSLAVKSVKSFVFGDTLTSQDDLRVLSGTYSAVQNFARARAISQVSISSGLGTFLNGKANGNPLASRVGAGDDFAKLNLDHVHYFQLDQKNALLFRFTGQLSDRALTVAELFSVGGADSVRGFVQSEMLGDEGYVASAELRHRVVDKRRFRLDATAFIDDGHATLLRPQPGEDGSRHATGVGLGFRTALDNWGTTRLELGMPISTGRSAEGDNVLLYAQHAARF